ncbi:MAG: SelB C-terminal domain-containing protein [Thermoanaerobaculia bacterium]|nr:SelB C-terminal domain-containing protein [Thermoanaerobaculia bacterium]
MPRRSSFFTIGPGGAVGPSVEHLDSAGVTRRVGDERMLRSARVEPGRDGV